MILGLSIATIFALGLVSVNTVAHADAIPGTESRTEASGDVSAALVPIGPAPIYQHNFGTKSISLYFGVDTLSTAAGKPQLFPITGFVVDAAPTAKFTLIEADVQAINAGTTNPVTFNGAFQGNIVENDGDFWTTFNKDVSANVVAGDIGATVGITSDFDCLVTQGVVFEEGSGQPASYVAAGVGLRGLPSGIINIAGIPANHVPVGAYLYWNVLNPAAPSNQIDIDGNTVTASHAGSDSPDPCWGQDNTWGFVADVTPYVSGNGAYTISNLPAGLMEGASLVVVHHPGVITCDAEENVCKTVLISQETEDGVIAVNELITYDVTVNAVNNQGEDILDAMLKDNFGGDVEIVFPANDDVTETGVLVDPDCEVKLKGNTDKAQVRCDIGTFGDGEEAGFTAIVQTDINPGQGKKDVPKREYTSCGIHDMNSGATLNGVLADGTLVEFSTGSVSVEVFEFADLSGDCDGDGFTDGDEINIYGTDPFDPADQPTCDGINTVDHCIDGDGYATAQRGTFTAVWGDTLSNWPSFPSTPEGIDAMKTAGGWVIGVSDLHSEDPASCPGAIRDGNHDLGLDCKILDLNNDLVDQEPVHCDFETGLAFVGCPAFVGPNSVTWIESIVLDGGWNNGEDIILDVNGNGFFD